MIRRPRTLRTHIASRAKARQAWLPVVLRWRARRKGRPQPGSRVTAASKQTFWLPQFHLHVAARAVETAGRPLATAAPALITVDRRKTVVAHHHWSVRRAAPAIARHRTQRTVPSPAGARMPSLLPQAITPRHDVRKAWSPSARAVTPVVTRESRPPLFERRVAATRPVSQPAERLAPRAPAPVRHREPDVMPRSVTRARRAQRQHAVEATAAPPHRSPDIVWRRAATHVTGHDVVEPSRRVFNSAARESAGQLQPAAGSAAAVVAGPAAPAPQPIHLDSALVDRLTDDVIRRVERRVRIERERRGLWRTP